MTAPQFDEAVVGAGILGLAHAYQLARRGRKVLVLERGLRAQGASIRNFGMLWPIGQPAGELHDLAMRSRACWCEVLRAAGLWHDPVGSLHLARADDEAQVLQEFVARDPAAEGCELWSPAQVRARAPWVRADGLRTALWSPQEICVDPRQVIAELPGWLHREFGVEFVLGTTASSYEFPFVRTTAGLWSAGRLWVCTGDDFHGLFPEAFAASGLVRCKLQMLRSQPYAERLGPLLAGGLTLRHYASFRACPSWPALNARLERMYPDEVRYGIHVMASQNGRGELILGDSHEYGQDVEIFDKSEIDDLILAYLRTFLEVPGLRIAQRWHGSYAKHPDRSYVVVEPAERVVVVTGLGGAGMTLSFGLADQLVRNMLGPITE